jgi:hypothetical protein
MIRFVVTTGHQYTLAALRNRKTRTQRLGVSVWSYRRLLNAKRLPPGTWIFTDLERLAIWELRLAGEVARLMREAGPQFRVLNDPALAACRYELLLRLFRADFNRFRAWRAEDGVPENARYPVFLRIESNHLYPVSGLVETPGLLAQELDRLHRMIIEYEAEALEPGVFRKFGAYRFGDRIVADHMVHDNTWLAKYGHESAWSEARFLEEYEYVRTNPHADVLMHAFQIANVDYGRADYGVIGGRVQIWEINTNPHIPAADLSKTPPLRVNATLAARNARLSGIEALKSSGDGAQVLLDSDLMKAHRGRQSRRYWDIIRE